jgi:L-fucose isomerase-like protein
MIGCSVLPVASALHGREAIEQLVGSIRPRLEAVGGRIVDSVEAADPLVPLAVLVLTGGTEGQILTAASARRTQQPGEPMLLITHPGHNSLPSALEALARLQLDGHLGRIVMVRPESPATQPCADLCTALHDLSVWHTLRSARLGLLGAPSEWLVASTPDREGLRRRWGVDIVDVELATALDRYAAVTDAPFAVPVRLGARRSSGEPNASDVAAAARFEPVLQGLVARHRLDAIAVRCFDLVTGPGTSGCLALSSLNDCGVIAGCEGDVASTVGLLWMRLLTGRLGWMANPAVADPATGVIELAHCTVPLSLVSGYELATHFESGLGVGIAGDLPPGPVTILRLGGPDLGRLWCENGMALVTPDRPGRCRTQLDVRVSPASVAELLAHPLGNHLLVIAGHHAEQARRWWHTMLAPVAPPTPAR